MIEIIVKGLKMPKAIFYLLTFIFLLTIIGCSSEQAQSSKPGVLKQPGLKIKDSEIPEAVVKLPLLLWPSFEYKRLAWNHKTKVEYCLITESEGVEINIGSKIEVLDEARCLYVLMSSNDGLPRPYTITLMKIRLIETGEEGWTWSKAIEPDK